MFSDSLLFVFIGREGELKKYIYVKQRTRIDSTTLPTNFGINDAIKIDTWHKIIVRIKVDKVTIIIDCKEVAKGRLLKGKLDSFPLIGNVALAQEVEVKSGSTAVISNRFEVSIFSLYSNSVTLEDIYICGDLVQTDQGNEFHKLNIIMCT